MPRQVVGKCSSSGSWPSSAEAVIAAQRATRNHMSRKINESYTPSASLSTNLRHEDTAAESQSPRQSIYQRSYLRQIDHQQSERRAISPTSSTNSTSQNMYCTLTTSASSASLKTQNSYHSDQSSRPSTRSSVVCVRDYPTDDTPFPGWQLHFVQDGAHRFEPLRDPDEYLYARTFRRDKEKAFSWKNIKQVRVSKHSCYCPLR